MQVAEGLQDEQIGAGFSQGLICSAKAWRACSGWTRPKGARRTPSGPTSPAIQHFSERGHHHPAGQLHAGPVDLGYLFLQAVRASLKRLAPKVLVWMICAPASIYSRWISRHQRRAGSG